MTHIDLKLTPIGHVESPLTDPAAAPKQGSEGSPEAPWEAVESTAYAEAAGEYLLPWPVDEQDERIDDLTDLVRASNPGATVALLAELVPDRFEYRAGVTYVGSTVIDLLDAGAGVCQDFVHLSLLLLRRNGIAARYVSGYLWSAPEEGGADSVEVQTHAWVEALLPSLDGRAEPVWVGADPTNRRLAGETHVKIGHGRRYGDVPPIRGVYRGAPAADLDASVRMSRLDPAASARA
ncbi:MAG TPA: transglutaminase family protein [Solirubrobacteraceae bacterium]|nr:transglutaminase family protein [Solirubrobacteraceae bacterium]